MGPSILSESHNSSGTEYSHLPSPADHLFLPWSLCLILETWSSMESKSIIGTLPPALLNWLDGENLFICHLPTAKRGYAGVSGVCLKSAAGGSGCEKITKLKHREMAMLLSEEVIYHQVIRLKKGVPLRGLYNCFMGYLRSFLENQLGLVAHLNRLSR